MDVEVLVQPDAQATSSPNGVTAETKTPPVSPTATASSASALATLLSSTLAQVETLEESLRAEKRRANHWESLATNFQELLAAGGGAGADAVGAGPEEEKIAVDGDTPMKEETDKSMSAQLAAAAAKIKDLHNSVYAATTARDEEMARRIAISDLWGQLREYLERLDGAGRDVRAGFDRIVREGGGVIRERGLFKDIPQLGEGDLLRGDRIYDETGALIQSSYSKHSYSYDHPREKRHSKRRPRSGSMDAYAYGYGPSNKRLRYVEEYPPPHPNHAYPSQPSGVAPYYPPPSHVPPPQQVQSSSSGPPPSGANHPLSPRSHAQQQQHHAMVYPQVHPQPPPVGSNSRHKRHPDSTPTHPQDQLNPASAPPGYEYPPGDDRSVRYHHSREYRDDRRPPRRERSRSYSRGRSPSRGSEGSLDVDEMLLAASTADEQHLQANGNGIPGQPQMLVSTRRKDRPPSSHGSGMIYDPRDGSQFVHHGALSVSPNMQHMSAHHPHHLGAPPPPPPGAPHPSQYPQAHPAHIPGRQPSPPFASASRPTSSRRTKEVGREPTLREDLNDQSQKEGRTTLVPDGSLGQVVGPPAAQVQYQTHVFAPVQTGAPVKKTKYNAASGSASVVDDSHTNSPAANPPSISLPNINNSLPLTSVNLAPTTSPFPPTNETGQRICRQCGMPGRYKEGKCVEKWGPGPMGPGTVCDRCRKKMKRVERRGTIEQAQMLAAQQAQARSHNSVASAPSYGSFSTPSRDREGSKISRTETVIDVGREGGRLNAFEEPSVSSIRSTSNARIVASSPFSKAAKAGSSSRPGSKAPSRAGSIVNGSKPSRRSSPVPTNRSSLASTITVPTSKSRTHATSDSVHSNGSGSGMDIDADADGDEEADLEDAEAEVEGDLAALVDQAASSPSISGTGARRREPDEDVDIAVSVLAGVDDDPDDYDSPATTNALKKQQAARGAIVGQALQTPTYGVSESGSDDAAAPQGAVPEGNADADAEADLLEAVDAAEANSAASSSG